jgi:restriction system protein
MVLRTAKQGPNAGSQFWGCSGYPRCRGTRKVEEPVEIS